MEVVKTDSGEEPDPSPPILHPPGFALLGCEVVFTDQGSIIPLLHRNVERNLSSASMAAQEDNFLGTIISHVMCSRFPDFLDLLHLVPCTVPPSC